MLGFFTPRNKTLPYNPFLFIPEEYILNEHLHKNPPCSRGTGGCGGGFSADFFLTGLDGSKTDKEKNVKLEITFTSYFW